MLLLLSTWEVIAVVLNLIQSRVFSFYDIFFRHRHTLYYSISLFYVLKLVVLIIDTEKLSIFEQLS